MTRQEAIRRVIFHKHNIRRLVENIARFEKDIESCPQSIHYSVWEVGLSACKDDKQNLSREVRKLIEDYNLTESEVK